MPDHRTTRELPSSSEADSENDARALDTVSPMAEIRERFHIPDGMTYMDGNSLGLLSRDAEAAVLAALAQWREQGIAGWLEADPPWFTLGESLGDRMAPLVGASPGSVAVTGTTTVNLHQMVASFFRPEGDRTRIVATALDFPSDIYALQGQIALRGGDPARDLVRVESRDGRTIDEDDLIAAMDDTVALALLPSVLYRSGQLLDMERLTAAAHERGVTIGFDCAHSAGAVPHALDAWGVDFAFWCTYKYLNAGPGAVGALYVHPRHAERDPALPGWWGYRKDRQFDMAHHWEGAGGAGAFQISTIPLLSAASLGGSLAMFAEVGIEAIRARSLALTDELIARIEADGLEALGYRIRTPREHDRRGGHIAVEHDEAAGIAVALRQRGIVPDFRQPNVIRLAPVALYSTHHDLWRTVRALREIVETGEHRAVRTLGSVT